MTGTECQHWDQYKPIARVCFGGAKGDTLAQCEVCGAVRTRRELAAAYRASLGDPLPADWQGAPATQDHPGHERSGPTRKGRSMSVPITPTGNQDARQAAQSGDNQAEDLGEGHIMGNLTQDPELRYTPSGRAVTRLRVAWTPRIKNNETGKYHDGATEYYDIDVWGQQGERVADQLLRGDRVVAAGNWTKRVWEDKDGDKHDAYCLTARDIGPSLLFRSATVARDKAAEAGASHD